MAMYARLETERLRLRPYLTADADALQRLAGAREIADTMISIPHPFSMQAARSRIADQARAFRSDGSVHFAVELRASKEFIGSCELRDVDPEHSQAELSFWIGHPWWGSGYAAEAAAAVLDHGFRELQLNRIYAHHMVRNPASGAVLRKLGMKQEGVLRQRVRKWGVLEDVALYAILRADLGAHTQE